MEKSSLVQVYLEAKTKNELIILMAQNNAKHSCFFRYSTPTKENKKYITWYYVDYLKYRLEIN